MALSFLLLPAFASASCGQSSGESSEGSGLVVTFSTLDEWCSTYQQPLPALSSPNPDGRELEVVEAYVGRYSSLAAGAPGIPSSTTQAMKDFAATMADVRDRVSAGEVLAEVLSQAFADERSDLVRSGALAASEADALCSSSGSEG